MKSTSLIMNCYLSLYIMLRQIRGAMISKLSAMGCRINVEVMVVIGCFFYHMLIYLI